MLGIIASRSIETDRRYHMMTEFANLPVDRLPPGHDSTRWLPVNGSLLFRFLAEDPMIVMACNPRIRHVIPGIMRAARELDAIVIFELTRTEGGVDGGYTGTTPHEFVRLIREYAERCSHTLPYGIHADHITVQSNRHDEIAACRELIDVQLEAGYTSFALDASFNPLHENVRLVTMLSKPIIERGLGLELELGEVAPVGRESGLTRVEDAVEFLSLLAEHGVFPHLLAINNGSHTGNYLDSHQVAIDLELTRRVYDAVRPFGVAGLVQHGITGTPLRIVGKLVEFGIRKGNIGTLWQNVAHAGLPLPLMDEMRKWARSHGVDIKYATRHFRERIDSIPDTDQEMIAQMAYREAYDFILAFNARGSASRFSQWLIKAECA